MFKSALLFLLLLCGQDTVWSVRLLALRVPAHEREGSTALLSCQYDLEGDELYSVKWYKGNQEFFRFIPKNPSPILAFNTTPGVNVNVKRSSSTVVVLENLSRESEGDYACEVSGEAPSFTTVRRSKYIAIHLIPDSGPHVTGLKDQYFLDELAIVNCTSSASRPTADLKWLVNDQPAPASDLRGPWKRTSNARPDAIETTLQLHFIVEPKHFVNGTMKLKCQATIAPLYQKETYSTHYIGLPFTLLTDQEPYKYSTLGPDEDADSSAKRSKTLQIWLAVMSLTLLLIF